MSEKNLRPKAEPEFPWKKSSRRTFGPVNTRTRHLLHPNPTAGLLHIGHATSICLNLVCPQMAAIPTCADDTNPTTEETEYVEVSRDVLRWLGFQWKTNTTLDYLFRTTHQFAISPDQTGPGYVDDSTSEEIAAAKGTPTRPGTDSHRNRTVAENLDPVFADARRGRSFPTEAGPSAPALTYYTNMLMRDPVLYRSNMPITIARAMPGASTRCDDFAHGQSDSIEQVTIRSAPSNSSAHWMTDRGWNLPSHHI